MSAIQIVRYGVPGAMLAIGLVLLAGWGGAAEAAGIVLVGSGVLVALAGALLRQSIGEGEARDSEQAARDHYLEHGRWPGEPAADAPPPETPPEPARPAEGHPGVVSRPLEPGRVRRVRRPRPPRR